MEKRKNLLKVLSVNEINEYLKKKYCNASAIEWHQHDGYWNY